MYRYLLAGALSFGLGVSLAVAAPLFQLRNEARQPVAEVNPERYFQPRSGDLQGYRLETEPARLAEVARATLAYLEQHAADDPDAVQPGLLSTWGVTLEDVKQTLRFIVRIQAEDQQVGRPSRLNQEAFLNRHFRFFSWQADRTGAAQHKLQLPDSRIRLTRYLVFEAEGSPVKTAEKNCALYALPAEESDLSADQAEARRQQLIRYRYTKQQVLAGVLQPHGVKPLVWVSRQGLEDALMQGSLKVRMPDGHSRMFNVHRNNGIAYDRQIRDPRQQKRYWYFREVAGIQGYGKDEKIIVQPAVTVAGDVYNLGLGKLVALSWAQGGQSHLRLAVLADTGGAFIPNLYQLDYLAGVFPDRESFRRGVQHLPEFVQASILLLRTDRH